MILIGERINSTSKSIRDAIGARDARSIGLLARRQAEAGAHYIEINAGALRHGEAEALEWLVDVVQAVVDLPLAIDSADPLALKAALARHRGKPIINSISGEESRFRGIAPLVRDYEFGLVVMATDDQGIRPDASGRVEVVCRVIERLADQGLSLEDMYVDPLLQPLGVDQLSPLSALEVFGEMRQRYPSIRLTCGLSNVSYGLPSRRTINRAYVPMAMAAGMDSAILDVTDVDLMAMVFASEALLGKDDHCARYLRAYRDGLIAE